MRHLKQGQEYRVYYWNTDKKKWIALVSYTKDNEIELIKNIEGYVAVFVVQPISFNDLISKTNTETIINQLNNLALVEGYSTENGSRVFKPNQPITGAEFAAMQARLLGMIQPGQGRLYEILSTHQPASDDTWSQPYIKQLQSLIPVDYADAPTVTKTQAIGSIVQLQQIIEERTSEKFTGDLYFPKNNIVSRAEASRLILSLIEGFGW